MNTQPTIAFIGAGNMSSAIIAGLLANNYNPENIWACSPTALTKTHLQTTKIHLTADNTEAAKAADAIVLGVKPHLVSSVCKEIAAIVAQNKPLIISVASGVTIDAMAEALEQSDLAIVRSMPNIAAAVCASATGLYATPTISTDQKAVTETIFRAIGSTFWLESEEAIDTFTPIAGSGPGYLFYIFEAMQAAAQNLGIEKESAKLMVAETALGAAKMVLGSPEDFEKLRRLVTSPNGTTQAATDILSAHHVKETFIEAIKIAYDRTKELSK